MWTSTVGILISYFLLCHLSNVLRTSVCHLLKYIVLLYLTLETLQYHATMLLTDFFIIIINSRLLLIISFLVSLHSVLQNIPIENIVIKQLSQPIPPVILSFKYRVFFLVVDYTIPLCAEWQPLFHSPPEFLFEGRITEVCKRRKINNNKKCFQGTPKQKNMIYIFWTPELKQKIAH